MDSENVQPVATVTGLYRGKFGGLEPLTVDTPLTRANRYAMPFLMPADRFAEWALRAIGQGVSYRVIPWQMAVVAKLLRVLPNALFDRLLSGRPRKARAGPTTMPGP